MAKSDTAIVVLNWNGAIDTINCIDSLLNQSYLVDIVVVDNNSTDNSRDILENHIKKRSDSNIHFIKNDVNSGFAGGNNTGIRYALKNTYRYIGSLNPDATADKEWVKSLVETLKMRSDCGIVTGLIEKNSTGTIDTTGEQYTIWGIPNSRKRGSSLEAAPDAGYIFAATGGGFIARADTLSNVGLFDEKFFMYFEDIDLCFRTQLSGYKIFYTPDAIAHHKIGASSSNVKGLVVYNTFKNLPLVFLKNVPLRLWSKILPRFSVAYSLFLANAIKNKNGWPAIKGILRYITLIPHGLILRRRIQKDRKVPIDYIDNIILHDIPSEQMGLRKFRNFFIHEV